MRSSRLVVRSVIVLALITTAGCTGSGGSPRSDPATDARPPPPVPAIRWKPCPDQGRDLECGAVRVPVDHLGGTSATLDMQVSRLRATDQAHPLGVMFLLPGGPGIDGTAFPVTFRSLAAVHPDDAAAFARFDLIGFAPRGTGADPVSCGSFTPLRSVDPSPDDAGEATALKDAAKDLAGACAKADKSRGVLAHVTSIDTAKDLEVLRQALRIDKVTLYGMSYGTRVFGTYTGLFPQHVRATVLDAPMSTTNVGVELAKGQMEDLDRQFTAFLTTCGQDPKCPFGGGDPLGAFDRLMQRWEQGPLPVKDRTPLTATQALRGYTAALFSTYQRPALLQALADADAGDANSSAALWEASQSPSANPAAALTGLCNDYTWPPAVQLYTALVTNRSPSARLSPAAAVSYLPCGSWPVAARRPVGKPAGWPTRAKGTAPILVLGGTADPSTPYAWAEQMASYLDHAVLVTRDGVGHVSFSRGTCISQNTARYLIDVALPAPGQHCPTEF